LLSLFEGDRFDEDALPLVTSPRPAEADDHGNSSTVFRRAPRQCSVARWKKFEIIETRTLKAERLL
jgi:hypothetical protein